MDDVAGYINRRRGPAFPSSGGQRKLLLSNSDPNNHT